MRRGLSLSEITSGYSERRKSARLRCLSPVETRVLLILHLSSLAVIKFNPSLSHPISRWEYRMASTTSSTTSGWRTSPSGSSLDNHTPWTAPPAPPPGPLPTPQPSSPATSCPARPRACKLRASEIRSLDLCPPAQRTNTTEHQKRKMKQN